MKIAIVGTGAFAMKHLRGLSQIQGVEIGAIVSDDIDGAERLADGYGAAVATTNLGHVLDIDDIDAVILCSPTPLHAEQAVQSMRAGKHVEIEIPLADNWQDCVDVAQTHRETGRICMVGHTRRFNPSHQWIHHRIASGGLSIQHLVVQTFFFRRSNVNAEGQPRSWTDNLLWHHAAHTVDLFQYQSGEQVVRANIFRGPVDSSLGIPLDMSIQLETANRALCSLSLSFNKEGPIGTTFRYICDKGTYLAVYDDLQTGTGEVVDVSQLAVSNDGIELQDREFVSAITEGRKPNSSVEDVISAYEVLAELERQISPAT